MVQAIEDVELDPSASTQDQESVQPAAEAVTDTNASNTATPGSGEADTQADGQAATPVPQSKPSEKPKGNLELALDRLSGTSKEKSEPVKPATKTSEAKATAAKAAKPAPKAAVTKDAGKMADPTPEELQAMPQHTRDRIQKLVSGRKQVEEQFQKTKAEYEAAKPDIERGKVFGEIVTEFGLSDDLKVLEDEDVAGVVIFQAALTRLESGKGTKADLAMVQKQFGNVRHTMEQLGIEQPAAKAPEFDTEALTKAVRKAHDDLDFTDLQKLVDGLTKTVEQPKAVPAPQPQARVRLIDEQAPQQHEQRPVAGASNAADESFYISRATRTIQADGIQDTKAYFDQKLYPQILSDLKASYPGQNPIAIFKQLSPQAKHDASVGAHQALQKQVQAQKPPAVKPAPSQRPQAAGGTAPSWARTAGQATTAKAAIDRLAAD